MRLAVYIRSLMLSPSGYYRVVQYVKLLEHSYKVRELIPYLFYKYYLKNKNKKWGRLWDVFVYTLIYFRSLYFLVGDILNPPDVIIISREIIPRFLLFPLDKILKYLSRQSRIIWDFDDHILYSKEISKKEFNLLSRYSKKIIVTSDYLKETIEHQYWEKTILLPTTDGDMANCDLEEVIRLRKVTFHHTIRLVWIGTAANVYNVNRILPQLDLIAHKLSKFAQKQLVLSIVSNVKVHYCCDYLEINNVEWSPKASIEEMCKAHVGIMPLEDSIYSRGKGGFKLVQYMAMALPVLASNVGFNKNVVSSKCGFLIDDVASLIPWENALFAIVENMDIYLSFSGRAYNQWEDNFSFNKNLQAWRCLLDLD